MFTSKTITAARAQIVGGSDITSTRSVFDIDDKHIITTSNRQIQYYNAETRFLVGKAHINSGNLRQSEVIVDSERLDGSLLVFTNFGRVFFWCLENRCWMNEIVLPIEEGESLISCKMLSKRQFIFTVLNHETNNRTINYSISRSERERPKSRDLIGSCSDGSCISFDILPIIIESNELNQNPGQQSLQRILIYMYEQRTYIQMFTINDKTKGYKYPQTINERITCVKACKAKPMIAVGDASGRIYLYHGNFVTERFNRTRLHWHSQGVNDISFSNTGNTLFSVGGENGCVVIWDLNLNNLGQKRFVTGLGLPIRFLTCANQIGKLSLSFEDNEIALLDTSDSCKRIKSMTRRINIIFEKNDYKAMRTPFPKALDTVIDNKGLEQYKCTAESIGLLWHSSTDFVVTNSRTGTLLFYDPHKQTRETQLNILNSRSITLEKGSSIMPSDITRVALSQDGIWLAALETRTSEEYFPEVRLHFWQKLKFSWNWVQTVDRIHNTASVVDLKFSADGKFLISLCQDGTFHIFHRIVFDSKPSESFTRQMYVKGFSGTATAGLPMMAAFSHDSSVLAISLQNDTILIWMIEDPYKLVYECQLNQVGLDQNGHISTDNVDLFKVLGLHFGFHQNSEKMAPVCEIRAKGIRIWNVLNPQDYSSYTILNASKSDSQLHDVLRFTAAAFDTASPNTEKSPINFAVCTNSNLIMFFKLELKANSETMTPLFCVDGSLSFNRHIPATYTNMCFLASAALEMDLDCYPDTSYTSLLSRLCLLNSYQELVCFTDQLTMERRYAINTCNDIKSLEISQLQDYFARTISSYDEETRKFSKSISNELDSSDITDKQRRIRCRLELQKMLKDIFTRIPSQNLPPMDILGPMILDKLIIN